MKIVNYRCVDCGTDFEDLVQDTEEAPEVLEDEVCPECQGVLKKWNFKANAQIWRYLS